MFLYWQTYEGFQLTVQSTIDSTKFLLGKSMDYFLTECFCQDPVEEFFGKQRQLGRRSDNPDINQFGHNSNDISSGQSFMSEWKHQRQEGQKEIMVHVTDEKNIVNYAQT